MSSPTPLAVRLRLELDRFDLEAGFTAAGHVTGVFGPSGAGKTSLLEAVAGLSRRARGYVALGTEVWLDTDAGIDLPPERRGVGYVPQDGLLFPHLDVRGNLLAGASRARRRGHEIAPTFETVCELLELSPLLERDVATLSGGERQRVALGRAICSGPRLLLLDEPLASLDLPLRRRVLPFLRRVRRALSLPMLLVTHDAAEVQALCDDLLVLDRGQVVARGPARAVLADPRVFPLTREEAFENVVHCRMVAAEGATSVVALSATREGLVVRAPRIEARPGAELLLGIPAREIILATRQPVGISAQNVLAATVTGVEAAGDLHLVRVAVAADVPELVAVVTAEARAQLSLAPGLGVYLVLKTAGCVLYGGGER